MRKEFLAFSKPTLSDEAIADVVACLKSGWITTGPRVKQFEENLQTYLKTPYALCVATGTAGLHLILKALDLKPSDEVIAPAFTFVASLNTIVLAGGKPVLVDIDPRTRNIDVTRIEAAITPNTRAIMPVHFAGLPCDLDPIYALAKKYNLYVIEDAAQAIGCDYKGQKIGSFGGKQSAQVFSFHPNKNMTTGEGGCVSVHDELLAKKIAVWRFHGIDRDAFNRFSKSGSQEYDVIEPGLKYNMMDMQAALGVHQLKALDDFNQTRTHLAMRYLELLRDVAGIELPSLPTYDCKHTWHLFTILIDPAYMERGAFLTAMKELNIGLGLHYQATHLFTYYKKTFGYQEGDFPETEKVANRIVSLPLFPTLTHQDQDDVISALKKLLRNSNDSHT